MVNWVKRIGQKETDIRSELEKLRKKYEKDEESPVKDDFARFESLFPELRQESRFNPFREQAVEEPRFKLPTVQPEISPVAGMATEPRGLWPEVEPEKEVTFGDNPTYWLYKRNLLPGFMFSSMTAKKAIKQGEKGLPSKPVEDLTSARMRERFARDPNPIVRMANTPTAIAGLTPADIAGIGLIAYGGYVGVRSLIPITKDVANKTLQKALDTGLDRWIAERSRGVPPQQFKKIQNFLYNTLVQDKAWLQERATNNMLTRMGRGVKEATAARQAVVDTMGEFDTRLPTIIPKGTQTGAMAFGGLPVEQPLTPAIWNAMPVAQRVIRAQTAGLSGQVGSKTFEALTPEEQTALSRAVPEVEPAKITPVGQRVEKELFAERTRLLAIQKPTPEETELLRQVNEELVGLAPGVDKYRVTPEPGMPEAGIQPAMIEGVPSKEVRPSGKGEIVQISMEDQLKLEQARQVAEEAPKVAYEAQAELAGLKEWITTEPARKLVDLIKKTGKLKAEVGDLTIKQFKDLTGFETVPANMLTADKKHVKWEGALDYIAPELGYKTAQELKDAIENANKSLNRIKELEADIKRQMAETPSPPKADLTAEEVTQNWLTLGQPKLTLKEVNALAGFFADYLNDPSSFRAWELTRELRREARAGRAENLEARTQQLVTKEGITNEEAMTQAIRETLSGELPVATTEYLEELTAELRDALFAKVYHTLKEEPYEMASTVTALTNALTGKPIPREPGVRGGSAYSRLQRVFGDQPKVLKAIDKMASEKKPLQDVVEGIYHETGREPIPIDQAMANYLRNLANIPEGFKTLLEPPFHAKNLDDLRDSITRELDYLRLQRNIEAAENRLPPPERPDYMEKPITDAFKELPMLTFMEEKAIVNVLKEIGWSPVDIGNFLRANKASLDFSFWRQQKLQAIAHPVSFYRANIEAWKALWSQKAADENWQWITRDPDFAIYDQIRQDTQADPLRVPIGESGVQYRRAEEFGYLTQERLIPRLTAKVPWVKISARSFDVGTNTHNWLIWKNYLKGIRRLSEQYASGAKKLKEGEAFDVGKEMTDFQKMQADFTQRASLGKASALAPHLSGMFFAPRSKLGRLLTPRHLLSSNPRVRKEAWKDISLFVGLIASMVMMGKWAGWWDVNTDPKSGDFMSIRIGNQRIDPWAGYRQILVFYNRAIGGTGVSSVTGVEYETNPIQSLVTMVRTSLSPMASLILDFWTGKNFLGEEVDVKNKEQWAERIAPFSVWDVYESYQEGWEEGVIAIAPSIVGEGVQTYPYYAKDFEEYNQIPSNPDELKAAQRAGTVPYSRSEYRQRNPEVDAKLFISGQVSTVKTLRAASEVQRLVKENKLKPLEISAVKAWQKADQKRKELGLRDTSITLTDTLIKRLLSGEIEEVPSAVPQGEVPLFERPKPEFDWSKVTVPK